MLLCLELGEDANSRFKNVFHQPAGVRLDQGTYWSILIDFFSFFHFPVDAQESQQALLNAALLKALCTYLTDTGYTLRLLNGSVW